MDVDVAFAMSACELRIDDAHLVELLCGFRAVFQHGSHSGIGIDVGILALHIRIACLRERDVLQGLHETAVHVAHAVALGAIEDVCLCSLAEVRLDERLFNKILHAFNGRRTFNGALFELFHDRIGDLFGDRAILHRA